MAETKSVIGTQNKKGQTFTDPWKLLHEAPRTPSFFTGSEVIKEAIRRAVVGGVDSIEHGTFLDEETGATLEVHAPAGAVERIAVLVDGNELMSFSPVGGAG